MHLIIYTSVCNEHINVNEALLKIREKALKYNSVNRITGALFYHNGRFLQIMEGIEDILEELMSKISKDHRHSDIELIVNEPINDRSFNQWHMDSFNLAEKQQLNEAELQEIKDIYTKYSAMDSQIAVDFYKRILEVNYSRNRHEHTCRPLV